MPIQSKWSELENHIVPFLSSALKNIDIAKAVAPELDAYELNSLRKYIQRMRERINIPKVDSAGQQYENALRKFCDDHGLPYDRVTSAKYITHSGKETFNVLIDNKTDKQEEVNWEAVMDAVSKSDELHTPSFAPGDGAGVVKISDLHIGAFVRDMIRTQDYSLDVAVYRLRQAANIVNNAAYKTVHVHILGDLIESFTGLNHPTSWKEMEHGIHGANAVKVVASILHKHFLSRVHNLETVKIVAGNHDRISSSNKEDMTGQAAELVAWGLSLMGYDIEFNPIVITHKVDGICHILTHGHHGISRLGTRDIVWEYGEKGYFNYICEGHLHSRIKKLARDHKVQRDDSLDFTRYVLPSFFTGNFYSESNGWTSNAGFVIIEDNGAGKPNTLDYSL
jgi:hypothetical protein